MQLNGTTGPIIMAASEPPEPPPRNPDKINASLKQIASSETKATNKSLDTSDRPTTNNNKLFKTILSDDSTNTTTTAHSTTIASATSIINDSPSADNSQKSIISNNIIRSAGASIVTASTAAPSAAVTSASIATTIGISATTHELTTIKSSTEYLNGSVGNGGEGSGSISSGGSGSGNENNVILGDEAGGGAGMGGLGINASLITSYGKMAINENTKHQPSLVDKNNANDIVFNNASSNGGNNEAMMMMSRQVQLNSLNDKMETRDGNRNDEVDRSILLESDSRLKQENERLTKELIRLKRLFEYSEDGAVGGIDPLSDSNSLDAHSTDGSSSRIERLEAELKLAKEQISHLRSERRKLRSDKMDLLSHVKQLCASLQDKEQELRDFIRNFEHRIRESESSNAKVSSERERERWSLLKHARDESERSLTLAAQLNARDIQLQRIQEQLQDARRQLSGCMSDQESLLSFAPLTPPSGLMSHVTGAASSSGFGSMSGVAGDRGSCSADSGVRGSSDRESAAGDLNLSDGPCDNGPCITVDPDSISLVSSHHNMYQYGTPKERSPTLSPLNSGSFSRSIDVGALSRSVEHLGSPVDSEGPPVTRRLQMKSNTGTLGTRSGRGGTWGSISRVFARTRHRNKNAQPTENECGDFQWSPLTEEGYAEKLRLLREASAMPIERWRASQVLAWLEVALGMPQYSARCSENVKSGKVLLELNDGELETGLGLTHPMHRKKLRLAIEEQRRPELIRYQTIGQLGHTWVASEWLPDIGLPQYTESFLHSLVDARMLDTLSKKELEKFLSVTRKFHQASIVHGIHVLRILKYDRQALAMRRLQCENVDADPIVWTNQRFIRWARSIDLGEYADNLKDSGVHGGLVVLEPSFSGDTIATALGIPPSKNIIRRHLTTEFDALVLPARSQLGQGIRTGGGSVVPITGPGGLQQHPHHHHSQQHHHHTADRRTTGSLRGSLSKAFRFNTKCRSTDRPFGGSSTSPTPSYSSSSENGIYATIGPPPAGPPPPPPTTSSSHLSQTSLSSVGLIAAPPPSHRVSAPPMDTQSSLPRYAQHRRVKSISDIEIVAATPV